MRCAKSLLLALMLILAGCVHTDVTRLQNATYSPTDPEAVRIFLDEGDIPGSYEKVALIHTSGSNEFTSREKHVRRAREEAAALGANGILLKGVKGPSAADKAVAAFVSSGFTDKEGEMIAIRYNEQ